MSRTKLLSALLVLAVAAGCRGWTSDKPPVHINPNMDTQPKVTAYRADDFYADGRGMRTPPEGTVARTLTGKALADAHYLASDEHYYEGIGQDGNLVDTPPAGLVVNEQLLERGRDRYNIYCSPCHAQHGTGTGLVASRLSIKPPTFHDELRYKRPLGYFYQAITHGVPFVDATPDTPKNMPSYAKQIPPEDRWAIALYVRALQRVTHQGPLPAPEPVAMRGAGAGASSATGDGAATGSDEAAPTGDAPPSESSDSTSSPPTPAEGAEAQQ